MGPIYAMGGQPGATTCIDGRGVGQPARRATHRTVHAPPAWPGHEPHITPRSLEDGGGIHYQAACHHGPLELTPGL
jgi:hypothetical protein